MTRSRIRQTLLDVGAISEERVSLYAERTRDRVVPVYRDDSTGVVFIDGFYVGEDEYETGAYRGADEALNLEDRLDTERRVDAHLVSYQALTVVDFGCGRGNFLRSIRDSARHCVGVELQESYRDALVADGIPCVSSMGEVSGEVDTCFMFHVLEHLPDPASTLAEARALLEPRGGTLVVEVPHARDFLLTSMNSESFKAFTLWSQHLVLHTRQSLELLLRAAGFRDISVAGVQRYSIANHLTWLSHERPGGHASPLASFETAALRSEYEAALARIDATDTLVANARA